MLDFCQVVDQIRGYVAQGVRSQGDFRESLQLADTRLRQCAESWQATAQRIENSKTSWLVAGLFDSPDKTEGVLPAVLPFTVLSADGSQIEAGRHESAVCCLINIGLVAITYGTDRRPFLTSRPTLFGPADEDLPPADSAPTMAARQLPLRRQIAELEALAELAEEHAASCAVALFDGTLILWSLEKEEPSFKTEILTQFERTMRRFREANVPVAGYISRPGSRDVINALRISACPHAEVNCDRYCPHRNAPREVRVAPPCAGTEHTLDADLYETLLGPGDRSAVFASRSGILKDYRPEDRTYFFYLNAGREIARVELPAWVAESPTLLERTQTISAQQAEAGDGYPVVLSEAHEQAVVRGAEREMFLRMLEREILLAGGAPTHSRKEHSKRNRRV